MIKVKSNAKIMVLTTALTALPLAAHAAPSILSVSGTVAHGNSITIAGSGFGSKSKAAPVVWDNGTSTNVTDKWSGGWPSGNPIALNNLGYRTPTQVGRGVALPHTRITKYLAGSHASNATSYLDGGNVMFWKARTMGTYPQYTYLSWYYRLDPKWKFNIGSPADNNLKNFDYSYGGEPYAMSASTGQENWYTEYSNMGTAIIDKNTVRGWHINDDGAGTVGASIANGNYYGGANLNVYDQWLKEEMEIVYTSASTGYIRQWENGTLVLDYAGKTDGLPGTARSEAVGGYIRGAASSGDNNWRYFADIYLDYSRQRVVICNGSTWANRGVCEVQVPTAWSDGSISATVNQASFADNSSKYLYVVDANGTASTGQLITFGTGSASVAPPEPSGLTATVVN